MLLLGFLLDLCFLPPLKLRLGELLSNSTAVELPELDEWPASVTVCEFVHGDPELAHETLVTEGMTVASEEPSVKPSGIGLDDDLVDTYGWRCGILGVGEHEGVKLSESQDEYVQVNLAAIELDVVDHEGPVVGRGAAEEDGASCWASSHASNVDHDRGLVTWTLLAAIGDLADLAWNCREQTGRVAALNLADVEICRRCVGVLVAELLVDLTPLELPIFLELPLLCVA